MLFKKQTTPPLVEDEIKTRALRQNRTKKGLRVQVNNHEEYHGQLGTVIEINEGCACSEGWCKVRLDAKERQRRVVEEFRYGKNGDVSDLLEVISEPPRPVNKDVLVTPETATEGTRVRISDDSEFSHQSSADGRILGPGGADGWVRVRFDNGYENSYKFGLGNEPSDLVLLP